VAGVGQRHGCDRKKQKKKLYETDAKEENSIIKKTTPHQMTPLHKDQKQNKQQIRISTTKEGQWREGEEPGIAAPC
jgi:hypothetical protein